eukprot:TRINITY_DN1843_c0_g2_i2.p1 TRINITY_DN1843_c0_g2~~TRINITY_DN1843_c0_g2_i2.p1  ORF type:complete len:383 (-),score=69.73 TRINITY_DN1843_c0_g2_i2:659-1807(-)
MVCSKHTFPSWLSAAPRVDFGRGGAVAEDSMPASVFLEGREESPEHRPSNSLSDVNMGVPERVFAAAGAAFLSAIIVNPLDVAKTRLQAQAAGVPYTPPQHYFSRHIASIGPNMYKGTMDVFFKVIRQEGLARLWRGTNAGLALAIPTVGIYLPCYDILRNWIEEFTTQSAPKFTPYAPLVAGSIARSLACIACSPIELARTRMQAYKEFQIGAKPPGMWKTLLGVLASVRSTNNQQNIYSYRILWTGVGAQLARDVPFSAICWSTLEPIRRGLLQLVGEDANAASILGANFTAGFVAGSLAAAATCPLDVAKTRRQIQKDPAKTWRMTTRQTLIEIWRDGGVKGLFTGIGPRVGRAGPSVGIVISFYEVVKYALHQKRTNS